MARDPQEDTGDREIPVKIIEEPQAERPTFPMKCGVALTLRPSPNPFAVKHLRGEAARHYSAYVGESTAAHKLEIEDATERMFLYLAGWCVEDDPPPDAIEEIETLFGGAKSSRVMRAKWVRYILLSDPEEASNFIAACLLITERLG